MIMSIYSNSMGNIYSCHCFRRGLRPSFWGSSYLILLYIEGEISECCLLLFGILVVATLHMFEHYNCLNYRVVILPCSGYERFTYQSIRQTWEEAGPHTIQGLQPSATLSCELYGGNDLFMDDSVFTITVQDGSHDSEWRWHAPTWH